MLRGGPWDKMPRMLQLFDCPALSGGVRPKKRILNTRFKKDGQVSVTACTYSHRSLKQDVNGTNVQMLFNPFFRGKQYEKSTVFGKTNMFDQRTVMRSHFVNAFVGCGNEHNLRFI